MDNLSPHLMIGINEYVKQVVIGDPLQYISGGLMVLWHAVKTVVFPENCILLAVFFTISIFPFF